MNNKKNQQQTSQNAIKGIASQLIATNNATLISTEDTATITGSHVKTGGNLHFSGKKGQTIQDYTNIHDKQQNNKSAHSTTSIGLKNQYIACIQDAKKVVQAKNDLKAAYNNYHQYQKQLQTAKKNLNNKLITKQDYEQIQNQSAQHKAAIALAYANQATSIAQFTDKIKSAGKTNSFLGFDIDAQHDMHQAAEKIIDDYTTQQSSTLQGKQVTLGHDSKSDLNITGSHITANQLDINAKNLNLSAGVSTQNTQKKGHHNHKNVTLGYSQKRYQHY